MKTLGYRDVETTKSWKDERSKACPRFMSTQYTQHSEYLVIISQLILGRGVYLACLLSLQSIITIEHFPE